MKIIAILNQIMGGSEKIRTCWPRLKLMEWASSSKS